VLVVGGDCDHICARRLGYGDVDDGVAKRESRVDREVYDAIGILVEAQTVLELAVVHEGVAKRESRVDREVYDAIGILVEAQTVLELAVVHEGVQGRWRGRRLTVTRVEHFGFGINFRLTGAEQLPR